MEDRPESIARRRTHPGRQSCGPGYKGEKLLCEVWSKVLGVENIGITDDFFSIGGDSISRSRSVPELKRKGTG